MESNLSLAPGFSRVSSRDATAKPFQRLSCAFEKPLKRLDSRACFFTRLKPGANETWPRLPAVSHLRRDSLARFRNALHP
jgi:hypothetical protein